ncbi:DUF2157 domain-containing protein [Psychrobacter aquaticus]|uniref:Membrane protein-like protein n=1 Tax=Psychrobacter aquaticus CMS 56 TaxID=1354303 RepID=U4TCY7_9GAMM|nr:DUF2157 domain-containing protein [Psychrobacter aquaticus]ERL56564.1 membrane protein-like protein [Psychrobacter aquaticus CMS 56]
MSQPRRTIEHLLQHGILPITQADAAASHLEVYPNKRTWLAFFDKALLVIGAVALALSLVFFIAYNWQNMGKMGKFALVEGTLLVTIALYVGLSFRRRFLLIRQLLLLIASIITGSLLALFGQVYQTGADTWQLFFMWALLITPWVVIARFPALWLLWLGLINASLTSYFDISDFLFNDYLYQRVVQLGALAITNFIALNVWLFFIENKKRSQTTSTRIEPSHSIADRQRPTKSSLHWSTYAVGLLSTYSITHLAIFTIFENNRFLMSAVLLVMWLIWCVFMVWRFYRYSVSLLMLTYLSGSVIIVVMFWAGKPLLDHLYMSGFLILALLLMGMSSAAVVWLRKVARLSNENNIPNAVVKGLARGRNDE